MNRERGEHARKREGRPRETCVCVYVRMSHSRLGIGRKEMTGREEKGRERRENKVQ